MFARNFTPFSLAINYSNNVDRQLLEQNFIDFTKKQIETYESLKSSFITAERCIGKYS